MTMFPDLPWFVWAFLGFIALVMIVEAIQAPKRKRERAAQLEKLREEAKRRGWSLEFESDRNFTGLSFKGTSEGVRWEVAATSYTFRGPNLETARQTRMRSVWRSDSVRLREGDLLAIWPGFGKADITTVEGGAGGQLLADLLVTPLISALGAERVDRQLFTRAAPYPAHESLVGHYALRAINREVMERFLAAGGHTALLDAAPWLPSRENNHLIVAVISAGGVTILLEGWIEDLELVGKLAHFGAALTNAARTLVAS